jgi:hypothetical protein
MPDFLNSLDNLIHLVALLVATGIMLSAWRRFKFLPAAFALIGFLVGAASVASLLILSRLAWGGDFDSIYLWSGLSMLVGVGLLINEILFFVAVKGLSSEKSHSYDSARKDPE